MGITWLSHITGAKTEPMGKPYDQFILFGDSITQISTSQEFGFGLAPALEDAYIRRLDVINRGFSGYTTQHAVDVLPKFFPSPQVASVRLMTIFFGANDACVPGNSQHVPIEKYKENLKTLIQHPAVRAQNPRIILITPPPINEYQLEDFDISKSNPHPTRTAALAKAYGEALKEVGAELNVAVADIWTSFMTSVGWKEGELLIGSRDVPQNPEFAALFTDGLHVTGAGYRLIFAEVMKEIKSKYPEETPASLPEIFPAWNNYPGISR